MVRLVALVSCLLASGLIGRAAAQTGPQRSVYWFGAQPGDGINPSGDLVGNHALVIYYGITRDGGADGLGTVYQFIPPSEGQSEGTEQVIWSFQKPGTARPDGGVDGAHPSGTLFVASDESLYGTTEDGGRGRVGTVFHLIPPAVQGGSWTEEILYSFRSDGSDLAHPVGGVIFINLNTFPVTTNVLGAASAGQCTDKDHCAATGGLFELVAPKVAGREWNEKVVYRFGGPGDGAVPSSAPCYGGIFTSDPYILTTSAGGQFGQGAVVRFHPPAHGYDWTEGGIYSFTGQADGGQPYGPLSNQCTWGVTRTGGANGSGTIFSYSEADPMAPWNFNVLWDVTAGYVMVPPFDYGYVSQTGGTTTNCGKDHQNGCGLVFELYYAQPPTKIDDFSFTLGRGATPTTATVPGPDSYKYGTTSRGGPYHHGGIYRFSTCHPCHRDEAQASPR